MLKWGYRIFFQFLKMGFRVAARWNPKLYRAFQARSNLLERVDEKTHGWKGSCYWVHVASSGEFEQALPILEALSNEESPVFVSYFSPSAEQALKLEQQRRKAWECPVPWDAADYLPFDEKKEVEKFIEILSPSTLICINREIWPELLWACHRRKIPCFLFVSYFANLDVVRMWFYRSFLKLFCCVATPDEKSAQRLKRWIPSLNVEILGDPRIERVLQRKERGGFGVARSEKGPPVLVLGSVWPKDLQALQLGVRRFLERHTDWKIIVAPHSPTPSMVNETQKWLSELGRSFKRRSQIEDLRGLKEDLVVDEVGHLAEMYHLARTVFVGGSFVKRVHNVLEPAAHACAVLTGPYITNSPEAQEMSQLEAGFIAVRSADEVFEALEKLTDPIWGQRALSYLLQRTGASVRYHDQIRSTMKVHQSPGIPNFCTPCLNFFI